MYSHIHLEANNHWASPDAEFTRSKRTLSAVWPSLRHGYYHWKVVCTSDIDRWAFTEPADELVYESYHCAQPEALQCGETQVGGESVFLTVIT